MWFYFWFWENTARGYLTSFHLFLSFLWLQPIGSSFLTSLAPCLHRLWRMMSGALAAESLPVFFIWYWPSVPSLRRSHHKVAKGRNLGVPPPLFFPFSTPPPPPVSIHLFRLKSTHVPFVFRFKATIISGPGLLQQSPNWLAGFFLCSSLIHFVYCCQWSLWGTDHMLLCYLLA